MSGRWSITELFAATTATIWVSAGLCKMYYTKRATDLIESKGWPHHPAALPAPAAAGAAVLAVGPPGGVPAPGSAAPAPGAAVAAFGHVDPSVHWMLSGSQSIGYATSGTLATAFGFWLLSSPLS